MAIFFVLGSSLVSYACRSACTICLSLFFPSLSFSFTVGVRSSIAKPLGDLRYTSTNGKSTRAHITLYPLRLYEKIYAKLTRKQAIARVRPDFPRRYFFLSAFYRIEKPSLTVYKRIFYKCSSRFSPSLSFFHSWSSDSAILCLTWVLLLVLYLYFSILFILGPVRFGSLAFFFVSEGYEGDGAQMILTRMILTFSWSISDAGPRTFAAGAAVSAPTARPHLSCNTKCNRY